MKLIAINEIVKEAKKITHNYTAFPFKSGMKFQSKSNVEWKLKWNSFNYKGKSFSVVLLENNIITIRNINKDEIIYTEQIK